MYDLEKKYIQYNILILKNSVNRCPVKVFFETVNIDFSLNKAYHWKREDKANIFVLLSCSFILQKGRWEKESLILKMQKRHSAMFLSA